MENQDYSGYKSEDGGSYTTLKATSINADTKNQIAQKLVIKNHVFMGLVDTVEIVKEERSRRMKDYRKLHNFEPDEEWRTSTTGQPLCKCGLPEESGLHIPEVKPVEGWKEELASWLHQRYEKHAHHEGWDTNPQTKVKFEDLPEANKQTMLRMAEDVQSLLDQKDKEWKKRVEGLKIRIKMYWMEDEEVLSKILVDKYLYKVLN